MRKIKKIILIKEKNLGKRKITALGTC